MNPQGPSQKIDIFEIEEKKLEHPLLFSPQTESSLYKPIIKNQINSNFDLSIFK